ncbi:ectonucleotide pyrophosphatase/phosphodiesterase [Coralloluteibacterium thermophilus]|uniref:Ectonucleotide pyrophosphatase/phosphodiesterase n=1 Tax=Coralloluteibacterium thermophilum TaxID=2707049 RepID=A0ABV9NLF2_9GAMM
MSLLNRLACGLAALFLLSACATLRGDDTPAPLILISLDGVHPDYLGRGDTPALDALAADGVLARWMTPSYPTLTFPNHYTLVTGLRPDHHGIVNNTIRDPELGRFTLSNREAVGDGRWWGGEPLWVTAQKAGLSAATMFWPGSEAEIAGMRPDRWTPFDGKLPPEARVDRLLGWMDLPAAARPHFITLYFEHVDSAGHYHGPESPERVAALAQIDAALQRLFDGLRARGLFDRVNIIVVSDHGMAETTPQRLVFLDDLMDLDDWEVVTAGQVVGLSPTREDAALPRENPHLQCWRKEDLPAEWHYGTHPRIPEVICQAAIGWKALRRADLLRFGGRVNGGEHGFAPEEPAMRALFLAHGPDFARGRVIDPIDNVDVYPVLAELLGLTPLPNDGDATRLRAALR